MQFCPSLQSATLLKRYKRFLADVQTASGDILTLHCANTGAMTGCATAGDTVWYSTSQQASRRYPHSWEITETARGAFICVNTLRANGLVREALTAGTVHQLQHYQQVRSEVRYPSGQSRVDFLLSAEGLADCYLEVKSVTLVQGQQGFFPDAVTTRGQKHLRELMEMVQQGQQAVLLFAVMHSMAESVAPASHIDHHYAKLLTEAQQCGVRILAYKASMSPLAITLQQPLPVIL